jgi:hypothetical protein
VLRCKLFVHAVVCKCRGPLVTSIYLNEDPTTVTILGLVYRVGIARVMEKVHPALPRMLRLATSRAPSSSRFLIAHMFVLTPCFHCPIPASFDCRNTHVLTWTYGNAHHDHILA